MLIQHWAFESLHPILHASCCRGSALATAGSSPRVSFLTSRGKLWKTTDRICLTDLRREVVLIFRLSFLAAVPVQRWIRRVSAHERLRSGKGLQSGRRCVCLQT